MARPAFPTSTQTSSDLIERERELAVLGDSLDAVRKSSRGQLVLVSGEAGVGKTALLRRFCDERAGGARVLWGACDALFTPTPLGPFLDIADSTGGSLAEVVEAGGGPFEVATALMGELRARPPTIVVLEDVHSADDATLDVLRLLGRRVSSLPAVVLVTYRQTELSRFHPLRQVLGEFGSGAIDRAADARTALRGRGCAPRRGARSRRRRPPRANGGQSVLRQRGARGGRGDPRDRPRCGARSDRAAHARRAELLEAVAVAPSQAELTLLEQCAPDALPALDECLSSGMLVEANGSVAFRHELARLAVEQAAAPDRKLRLHRATLAALRTAPETQGRPREARASRGVGSRHRSGARVRAGGRSPRIEGRRAQRGRRAVRTRPAVRRRAAARRNAPSSCGCTRRSAT